MPGEPSYVAEVENFLAERGERLLRAAIVLAGSRDAGEDLLQAGLERLFKNWRKVNGDPEGYLRRTLARLAVDGGRRRGRCGRAAARGSLPAAGRAMRGGAARGQQRCHRRGPKAHVTHPPHAP
jgi:DNA-directed RNA polymerase specialized sigma24 family protein